jgi:predicted amidohydrolase
MKLACVQFCPAYCDLDETIRRLEPLLEQVREADLIVLPELCNSGYNFRTHDDAVNSAEPVDGGPFGSFLQQTCDDLDCEICAGLNERDGNALYNSAVLMSARGVEGLYRKMHLFVNEKDHFAPGDAGLPIFDRSYGRIGIQICFDWIFPEPWRILALKGAEVICHPSNLVLPDRAQRAVPVHAMLNRVFVATANRIGTEDDLTFTGLSLITDARGNVMRQASTTAQETIMVEIDPQRARDKMATARNHVLDDRRPDQYRELLE